MPWCPKCRFEYIPQVTRCPECGSELVAELPEETAARQDHEVPEPIYGMGQEFEQVVIGTVLGEMHASLVIQALQAEGIPSRTQFGGIPDFAYPGRTPNLPIGIFVNKRDEIRARMIFHTFEQTEVSREEDDEDEDT